jgi:hypothetical protein
MSPWSTYAYVHKPLVSFHGIYVEHIFLRYDLETKGYQYFNVETCVEIGFGVSIQILLNQMFLNKL